MGEGAAAAAILLRHLGAEQTGAARLVPDLPVDLTVLLPLFVMGHAFALEELARGVGHHFEFFRHPFRFGDIQY